MRRAILKWPGRSFMWQLPLLLGLVALAPLVRAEVLDRIAVTIGRQVIPESEVRRAMRVAAFLDQKPVPESGDAKRQAAERLVDRALILREAAESHVPLPGVPEGSAMLDQVRRMYASPEQYQAALRSYDVTENDVLGHLLASLRALRFTDNRFRADVQVTEEDLREYYQFLAAGWRRAGTTDGVPTFEEAREQVEKILLQQRTIQALDAWLSSTRTQLGVLYRQRVFE